MATRSPDERRKAGAAIRSEVARSAHSEWAPHPDRADPVGILIEQGKSRIQELLPIRYGRMRTDPFAFLRAAAAVMAADLAHTASTGIRMQACGDAHLANFGSYATPEGLPVFDISDFDEALPAPFEWDLKRLATSLVVAGRVAQYSEKDARSLARTAAQSYREHMAGLAQLSPIEAWNRRIDLTRAVADIDQHKLRDEMEKRLAKVLDSGAEHFGLVETKDGEVRIREKPPLVHHLSKHDLPARKAFASYAETLQEDRRVLLQRHKLRDVAFKAVGVGSVGTFCAIGLLTAGDGSPLLLQIKEAQEIRACAVCRRFRLHQPRPAGRGRSAHDAGRDRHVSRLDAKADRRGGTSISGVSRNLKLGRYRHTARGVAAVYASLCGRTLARAHGRAGDPVLVSGYAGGGTALDDAIGEFAIRYADQTEKDWKEFLAAIRTGRIVAADA